MRSSAPRPSRWRGGAVALLLFVLLVACARLPADERPPPPRPAKANARGAAAADALVTCELRTPFDEEHGGAAAQGTLRITVHRSLAPRASAAFLDLVTTGHFDRAYLFRVIEGFIVQWGIEALPPKGATPKKFPKAKIDPVGKTRRLNVRGALNFAGGNAGTGQVYVNRANNPHLDTLSNKEPGSLPFATLDEESMAILDAVYAYEAGMGQVPAVKAGDEEVRRKFPRMSRIEKCRIKSGVSFRSVTTFV